ncbi:PREDICTED: uncharacterized protein LOC104804575 [Tarenaya hassleriana]|uniref:uncharacterized protein LOC104804575 n=1 Tax=Tarenaya hassleriana TaxID=28532 RepID=UPI00053C74FD|nr:PREDICTED: uncharacterized protein LOC104804575 [Tarenaya hassleriana]
MMLRVLQNRTRTSVNSSPSFRQGFLSSESCVRKFCGAVRDGPKDEGDWFYSSEWWEPDHGGYTVFRSNSDKGNGVVSVVAHPSSRPSRDSWAETERWLGQRYMEIQPRDGGNERFKILGYQWRSLHFNDDTRQSTVKVMAACMGSQPGSVFFAQQPHCLALPYVRSMVSVGLTTLAASKYDLKSAACGKKPLNILCIGHGGGSLPLFLASHVPGAVVTIVEIDPIVISASIRAMGFPAFSVMTSEGQHSLPSPDITDQVLWRDIHERLRLYESDAEEFVLKDKTVYDLVFMDAYDGADIFSHKLWDSNSLFMKALSERLHHGHGTLVVNLHSDSDVEEQYNSNHHRIIMGGKYTGKVGEAYRRGLLGGDKNGLVFACAVPWLCNISLVVSRGLRSKGFGSMNRDTVMNNLMNTSLEVDHVLRLPFSCWEHLKAGIAVLD